VETQSGRGKTLSDRVERLSDRGQIPNPKKDYPLSIQNQARDNPFFGVALNEIT
jgi:hypothetical protein